MINRCDLSQQRPYPQRIVLRGGLPWGIRLCRHPAHGVQVHKVRSQSKAASAGIREGDTVMAINESRCQFAPLEIVNQLVDDATDLLSLDVWRQASDDFFDDKTNINYINASENNYILMSSALTPNLSLPSANSDAPMYPRSSSIPMRSSLPTVHALPIHTQTYSDLDKSRFMDCNARNDISHLFHSTTCQTRQPKIYKCSLELVHYPNNKTTTTFRPHLQPSCKFSPVSSHKVDYPTYPVASDESRNSILTHHVSSRTSVAPYAEINRYTSCFNDASFSVYGSAPVENRFLSSDHMSNAHLTRPFTEMKTKHYHVPVHRQRYDMSKPRLGGFNQRGRDKVSSQFNHNGYSSCYLAKFDARQHEKPHPSLLKGYMSDTDSWHKTSLKWSPKQNPQMQLSCSQQWPSNAYSSDTEGTIRRPRYHVISRATSLQPFSKLNRFKIHIDEDDITLSCDPQQCPRSRQESGIQTSFLIRSKIPSSLDTHQASGQKQRLRIPSDYEGELNDYQRKDFERLGSVLRDRSNRSYADSYSCQGPVGTYPTVEEQKKLARRIAAILEGEKFVSKHPLPDRGNGIIKSEVSHAAQTDYFVPSKDQQINDIDDDKLRGLPHFIQSSVKRTNQDNVLSCVASLPEFRTIHLQDHITHTNVSPKIPMSLAKYLQDGWDKGTRLFKHQKQKAKRWVVSDDENNHAHYRRPQSQYQQQRHDRGRNYSYADQSYNSTIIGIPVAKEVSTIYLRRSSCSPSEHHFLPPTYNSVPLGWRSSKYHRIASPKTYLDCRYHSKPLQVSSTIRENPED